MKREVRDLSKKFKRKWEETPRGLGRALRRTKPLRPKINYALNRVEMQIQRINNHVDRYAQRDKELFEKLSQAYERHDNTRVKMLANEIAEIRKQRGTLMHSKLSLDNVALRLRTVFEFGNFVSAVTPVVGILNSIRTGIAGVAPDVGNELHQVETTLGDIMVEMGQASGVPFDFEPKSEDAEKIIKEAATIAESRMKTKLPQSPGNLFQGGQLINKSRRDADEQY